MSPKAFLLCPLVGALLCLITPPQAHAAANGRFGIALGTWNFDAMKCFQLNGDPVSCREAPYKHYNLPAPNFVDMDMTSYDGRNYTLARSAFNVADFDRFDPNANTQFMWFHYEDNLGNTLLTGNTYITQNEMVAKTWDGGAQIYATSGAPGSIRIRVIRMPPGETYTLPQPINGQAVCADNCRYANFKLQLAQVVHKNGYPYCVDCIYQKERFLSLLQENTAFDDGWGNWYGFYLLAEIEYPIASHYLTPPDYAAILNTYVEEIKTRFPQARFILASPVAGGGSKISLYYNDLYHGNGGKGWLAPLTRQALNYNSLDIYYSPAALGKPDRDTNNVPGLSSADDLTLQTIATTTVNTIASDAKYFYTLNGKKTLITQIGSTFHSLPAHLQAPGSIYFDSGTPCSWCTKDSDVFTTTEYQHARLTQLVFRQLLTRVNSGEIPVDAWAYWGIVNSPYWTEPLIQKTWGYVNHGVPWLTWNILCTPAGSYGYSCPHITNKPWPTHLGMVYLTLANGDLTYRPADAPAWWPVEAAPTPPSPPPTPADPDHDGDIDHLDILRATNLFTTIFTFHRLISTFGR